ncbi:hypothetical protein B0H15DRAFT_804353 [Mycena belliarum]|uniref:Uncharacterized protein n=1 Tax=Mycena belliarum TaxID=1033014 RepID=A0AAD6XQ29_9AGAR|nr:hypothetical protein B0H15DRAFT_804353 [Mycena belliae]
MTKRKIKSSKSREDSSEYRPTLSKEERTVRVRQAVASYYRSANKKEAKREGKRKWDVNHKAPPSFEVESEDDTENPINHTQHTASPRALSPTLDEIDKFLGFTPEDEEQYMSLSNQSPTFKYNNQPSPRNTFENDEEAASEVLTSMLLASKIPPCIAPCIAERPRIKRGGTEAGDERTATLLPASTFLAATAFLPAAQLLTGERVADCRPPSNSAGLGFPRRMGRAWVPFAELSLQAHGVVGTIQAFHIDQCVTLNPRLDRDSAGYLLISGPNFLVIVLHFSEKSLMNRLVDGEDSEDTNEKAEQLTVFTAVDPDGSLASNERVERPATLVKKNVKWV